MAPAPQLLRRRRVREDEGLHPGALERLEGRRALLEGREAPLQERLGKKEPIPTPSSRSLARLDKVSLEGRVVIMIRPREP